MIRKKASRWEAFFAAPCLAGILLRFKTAALCTAAAPHYKKSARTAGTIGKILYYRLGALFAAYGCLLLYNFDDFAFVFGFGGVGIGGSGALENL